MSRDDKCTFIQLLVYSDWDLISHSFGNLEWDINYLNKFFKILLSTEISGFNSCDPWHHTAYDFKLQYSFVNELFVLKIKKCIFFERFERLDEHTRKQMWINKTRLVKINARSTLIRKLRSIFGKMSLNGFAA